MHVANRNEGSRPLLGILVRLVRVFIVGEEFKISLLR